MKKLIALLLALCLTLPLLPALGSEETRVFTDDAGREVTVKKDIGRIVVSGPLAQIYVFALAPELFAGLASRWKESELPYIPDAYHDLPVTGQLYGGKGEVNLEELVKLSPDLLIDLGEAKKSIVEDMDSLQQRTGIPCVHIEAGLSTSAQAYRRLGDLLGKAEEAEKLAAFCENAFARAQSIMEKVGENRKKVVYFAGIDGLSVLAKTSFHAEVIDMLCDNAAVVPKPSSRGTGDQVDMEQLLLWDPDIMIFAPDTMYEKAKTDPQWQALDAIREGRSIEVPKAPYNWMGNPSSVHRYLSLLWLPAVLYPEYADYDLMQEVQTFYELFFHKALSEDAYRTLTRNAFLPAK